MRRVRVFALVFAFGLVLSACRVDAQVDLTMVEDPLSERLLWKEFRAGQIIVVDAEVDPESETNETVITFTSKEGFEPPSLEMAEAAETGSATE